VIARAMLDALIAAFRELDLDTFQVMANRTEGRVDVTIDASEEASTRRIAAALGAPEPCWHTGVRHEWLQSQIDDAGARLTIRIFGGWRQPSRAVEIARRRSSPESVTGGSP
jgi:hypothetical protein